MHTFRLGDCLVKKLNFVIIAALLLGSFFSLRISYSSGTAVSLTPSRLEVLPGQAFTVGVKVANVSDLSDWQVAVEYDAKVINCTAAWVPEDNVFTGQSQVAVPPILNDPTNDGRNYTFFGNALISGSVMVDEGFLCKLNFTALAYGQTTIRLGTVADPIILFKTNPYSMVNYTRETYLLDSNLAELPFIIQNSEVLSGPQTMLTILQNSGGTTDPAPGNHTYAYGTNASVTGIPNSNCVFDHWLLNATEELANPLNVTMSFNYKLQPFFVRRNYTLTMLESANGTTNLPQGEHTYYSGEIVQVIATASTGFRFDHWVLNGSETGSDNPLSLVLDGNYELSAAFSVASFVGTVYIRADGLVNPADAPFSTLDNVTYTLTEDIDSMVVIQRSNVVLDGSWYTLQGSGSGEGVSLFGVSNVTVKNMNIRGFGCGMYLFWASRNVIARNNITGNNWLGLRLYFSSNNSIYNNNASANKDDGIRFEFSSNYNSIIGNNIMANTWLGVHLDSSSDNNFYHNNFANNANQVSVDPHNVPPQNFWNSDMEGNYWSDYIGVDSNYDGVGDTPYTIDSNNTDRYPLVGRFSILRPSSAYQMEILSNSTITNFNCSTAEKRISFEVDGQNNTMGFCKMTIPHNLVNPAHLQVLIDDGNTPLLHFNRNLYDNLTHRWIYFAYVHSIHTILIQEDTIPPMISVISPENKTYANRNVALTFTINESASWMGYSLNGEANVTLVQNTTLTVLADGVHSLCVYASDAAGNTGVSTGTFFTVDSTPPNIISTVQYPPVNNVLPSDNVDVNATVIDNVTVVRSVILTYVFITISGADNGSIVMTEVSPNVWTAMIPKLPYRTNVTYTIAATDNAGNTITSEQLGYNYQYTVVPEYPVVFIALLCMAGLFVVVLGVRKKMCDRRN